MPASTLPTSDYVDSYYARTTGDDIRRAPLSERVEAEVCVVGGGMAGLATALGLAERGRKVVLLEARRVGWGASGRNGGFVSHGFAKGLDGLYQAVGRERTRELYALSDMSVELVRNRVEQYAIDCGPLTPGLANCSWFDDADAVRRRVDHANELVGAGLEFWPREKVRDLWHSPRYFDAAFKTKAFTFHSLNFTRGIARAAEGLGVRIFEDTPVTSVDLDGEPKRITTAGGSVVADEVVFCCSGYIDGLVGALDRATLPIGTYVLLTEPISENKLKSAINAPHGVSDDRFATDYYRPLPDGRILWGGRISRRTDPSDLAALMLGDLVSVYPQLSDVKAEVAWPGTMGYATHKMPQIGRLRPGVWYNQGHGGHGMASTTLGGELVASAIAEGDERYRLFEPFGLSWAGGPLGTWVAQLTYWKYELQDAWRLWRQGLPQA